MPEETSGLTAALLQLSALADKLSGLDHREAGHAREITDRINALTTLASALKGTIADQAEILRGLAGVDEAVADLTRRLDQIAPPGDDTLLYLPSPVPRFWKLDGEQRAAAIEKLRAWVEQVYRPGYGWISASLGDCWQQHPVCLYGLDWLSELWSVLYLQGQRTPGMLSGQAEWQTRILPAIAEQMARETSRCQHAISCNGHTRLGARP